LNVLAVIVGTVEWVASLYGPVLDIFELVSILVFCPSIITAREKKFTDTLCQHTLRKE
jgi:hypothetical protein